jgi:hypothetical protein
LRNGSPVRIEGKESSQDRVTGVISGKRDINLFMMEGQVSFQYRGGKESSHEIGTGVLSG